MRQYDPSGSGGLDARPDLADPETKEIRVEIEQTRTEMSGTIDAIQRRLAPDVLTEQAKDIARDATDHAKTAAQEVLKDAVQEVKDAAIQITEHAVHEVKDAARDVTAGAKDAAWDATVGRAEDAVSTVGETARGAGSIVIETIKNNPIPAALAGISLAWLYMHRSAAQPGHTAIPAGQYRPPTSYQAAGLAGPSVQRTGYANYTTGQGPQAVPVSYSPVATPGMSAGADDQGSGIVSQVGDLASGVASSVASGTSQAASSAGHMASTAGEVAVDTGSTIIDIVKRNPVPAALVGIGLSWLYMNRSAGSSNYAAHRGSVEHSAADAARHAGSRMGEMAGGVQDQVGDAASAVQEHVGDIASSVKDRTMRAPGQLQQLVEDNPLLTAALAASLGGAVGLALPSTRSEDQILGSTRDRAMGRAHQMTDAAMDKVQSVAKEVQTTVSKEAEHQGLTV